MIAAARTHADEAGLAIDYRTATAETLVAAEARFDAVLALEVVEHVPDPDAFLGAAARLVAPGGALIVSTLNRTPRAFFLGIVAAEHMLALGPARHPRLAAVPAPVRTGRGGCDGTGCGSMPSPASVTTRSGTVGN